ncbi:uncharacterized protein J3R85_009686 [Psidium guajava]|nr:uncharacterized protein J3R85_009686 [Psidium guajava]
MAVELDNLRSVAMAAEICGIKLCDRGGQSSSNRRSSRHGCGVRAPWPWNPTSDFPAKRGRREEFSGFCDCGPLCVTCRTINDGLCHVGFTKSLPKIFSLFVA